MFLQVTNGDMDQLCGFRVKPHVDELAHSSKRPQSAAERKSALSTRHLVKGCPVYGLATVSGFRWSARSATHAQSTLRRVGGGKVWDFLNYVAVPFEACVS